MKRMVLAFLALIPDAANASDLCEAVALEVRQAAATSPGRMPTLDDLKAVATASPPLEPFRFRTDAQAIAELKRRFNASGPEFDIVASATSLEVTQVGRTGPIALWDVQGTAHCSYYQFLLPGGPGPATHVPSPIAAEEADICWMTSGWLGEILGEPVFAIEDRDNFAPALSIEITPWRDGRWAQACKVEARYEPRFQLIEALYRDQSWKDLGLAPENLAQERHRRDEDPTFSFYQADVDQDHFEAMLQLTGDMPLDLPRFGAEPQAYDTFDGSLSPFFPFVVGERTYLGRIGHGTLGWRVTSDYLIGVWDLIDGRLEPVASFTVATQPGDLTSLRVSNAIPLRRGSQP